MSAGFNDGKKAMIKINDIPVKMEPNENQHLRGLHIVIVNPQDGKIETAKVFDTYESSKSLDKFLSRTGVPLGYIIVAACSDDCTANLSPKATQWLKSLGSLEIDQL